MKTRWVYLLTALVVASLLLAPVAPVSAQDEQPPAPPRPSVEEKHPDFIIEDEALLEAGLVEENGLYRMEGVGMEMVEEEVDSAASYSSADAFGYRYQKVTPAWIDATVGTPVEIIDEDGYSGDYAPVILPFPFRFYGRVYESVNVSKYGHVMFGDQWTYNDNQSVLGLENEPNNVIAPYWAPMGLGEIFMLSGGVAPNRWVVFSWTDMFEPASAQPSYNFQAVLYENGQILFQYDLMEYVPGSWCGTAGIEDRIGLAYKATLKFCYQQASYKAFKFFPPKPSARVWLYPAYYGDLAMPGETVNHEVFVENNGELGTDVFDLTLSSKWPGKLMFFNEDLGELVDLTDTDGDKKIDTGPLAEGQSMQLLVQITVPLTTKVGYRLESTLKITSSLNKGKSKTARIHTAVPANFAQLEGDDWNNWISTYESAGSNRKYVTNDDIWYSNDGILETTGRLFYYGTVYDCIDEECWEEAEEIHAAVYAHDGSLLGEHVIYDMTNGDEGYSEYPSAAAAPNGAVGFAWTQMGAWNETAGDFINEIFFAVTNPDGNVITGPVNLTNHTSSEVDPQYPKIAATSDGKFVVAWQQVTYDASVYSGALFDIQYAVVNQDGSLAVPPAVLALGEDVYPSHRVRSQMPSVTQLSNGNTLIAWPKDITKYKTYKHSLYVEYAVVNNAGIVLKRSSIAAGSSYMDYVDGAQMSGGQIVLAWDSSSGNKSKIFYAILSGTSYKKTKGVTSLNSSSSLKPGMNVSVTVDNLNHAVLTWSSTNNKQLYYAMLGKNGATLTKPMVYRTGVLNRDYGTVENLYVGWNGQANTTFTSP